MMQIDNNQIRIQEEQLIARYLKGQLNEAESSEFEVRLKTEKDFKARVITHARLVKAMNEVGQQRDYDVIDAFSVLSKNTIEHVSAEVISDSHKQTIRKQTLRWSSIAASVLVVVCLGLYYNDYRTTIGLGEQYATAFIAEQSASRDAGSSKVQEELNQLYANVRSGKDLDATIARLSILWELANMEIYNDYTDEAPYIGWNLACAYLRKNEKEKCSNILLLLKEKNLNNGVLNRLINQLEDSSL